MQWSSSGRNELNQQYLLIYVYVYIRSIFLVCSIRLLLIALLLMYVLHLSPFIVGEMHQILLSVRFVFMTSLSRVQSNGR